MAFHVEDVPPNLPESRRVRMIWQASLERSTNADAKSQRLEHSSDSQMQERALARLNHIDCVSAHLFY